MKHGMNESFGERIKHIFQKIGNYIHYLIKRFHLIRWLFLILLILFLTVSVLMTFKAKTSDVGKLKASLQTTTTIVDASGHKAGSLYSQKGTYVNIDKISPEVQNAVISTEDRTFWTNPGFSFKGYARAFLGYLLHHQVVGGGSTITQQLAKNSLLTQKQTLSRKVEELFLAIEINHVYSKKDILSMYLNNAYFGNGVWGVQDASKLYFNEDAKDLDAAQGATLAAMLRNPSFYDPIDNPKNSTSRRNLILGLMADNNKISKSQMEASRKEPLSVVDGYKQKNGYRYPSYFDAVISEAETRYHLDESTILNKGYTIYTSLDQDYQAQMQQTFDNDSLFPADASDGTKAQAASIAINPKTGGVAAVVGGRGKHVFRDFNRATQMKRQPGSTIKPLAVYTPAIESGYKYDTMLPNKVTSFGKNHYTPTNADGTTSEQLPMYKALATSENIPAVALLDKIGVNKGVSSVQNFGINVSKSDRNLALALGGLQDGVTPYQMARAYTAFANKGSLANTHFITKIVDANGAVVGQNDNNSSKLIMSDATAKTMNSMMLDVFKEGTGQSAQPSGYKIAGKTGSTEVPKDYGYGTKDQWIIGYTPDLVVANWVGFDKTDKQHFLQGTSESGVAPAFKAEMQGILPYTKNTKFDTEDADTMANNSKKNSPQGWFSNIGGNLGKTVNDTMNNINNAGQAVGQWYNQIKGLIGNQ